MNDYQERKTGYESGAFQEAPSSSETQKRNYQSQYGGQRRFSNYKRNEPPRDFSVDPPTLYRPYVGTGNADAPEEILQEFKNLAQFLEKNGYIVRTSAFDGPDKSFGIVNAKETILPWKEFAGNTSKLTFSSEEAKFLAKKYFPAYDSLKDTVKAFLAKNIRLLCGQNLKSPAQFLVLWTEDGCEDPNKKTHKTGYASHLIAIAYELRIPIFNFGNQNAKSRLISHLRLNPS